MFPVMMSAAAMLTVFVVVMFLMVMAATVMLTVLVVMMLPMVMATAAMLPIFMMVVMVGIFQLCQGLLQGVIPLHGLLKLFSCQLSPRCCDQSRILIMLPKKGHCMGQLFLGNRICSGQDNGRGTFNLVIIKLTKVFHIDLYLCAIHNSNGIAQCNLLIGNLFHCRNDIRQLTNAGGLNDNSVGIVFPDYFGQCLAKISHKRTANTAGIHLGNVDARILQKTAVNANFTEFIFDKNQLFSLIGFRNHFLD